MRDTMTMWLLFNSTGVPSLFLLPTAAAAAAVGIALSEHTQHTFVQHSKLFTCTFLCVLALVHTLLFEDKKKKEKEKKETG